MCKTCYTKNRGVQDALFFCVDGLAGFKEAIGTVYPEAQIQRYIIHNVAQKHGMPNYQREMHGVFRGDVQTAIEDAWSNRANAKIASDGMGEQFTIYHIRMQVTIQDTLTLESKWII